MEVLAIDPGTTQSAYVVFNGERVVEKGIVPNDEIFRLKPREHMAIEMIASYGMAVGREVFETVLFIGRIYEHFGSRMSRYPTLIYRKDVKMFLCNSMKAKDPNIRQSLIDRFGKPNTKKDPNPLYNEMDDGIRISDDMWAALAIAVTYFHMEKP